MRWPADQVFIPPQPTPWLIALSRWALPACLRHYHIHAVDYDPADLQRLRDLQDQRVALFPNHPTGLDPAILYDLGKQARQPFYFLAAREVFDHYGGKWGWVVQHVGGYSIVRGAVDRASFKMTRTLLTQAGVKLVIFPEGLTYSQNDSLLPFHGGVTQLLFWAQEDLLESGVEESVYVLPVAVKYQFLENMRPAIERVIAGLERAVGVPAETPAPEHAADLPDHPGYEDLYPRLRRIGATVVGKLEGHYGLPAAAEESLAERMVRLKQAIVERVAGALQVAPQGDTLPDRLRFLSNTLYEVTDEEPRDLCHYDRHLWDERRRRVLPLMGDLDRLSNWIAVYDGYVAAKPTTERMADLIRRLEIEALGPWHPGGSEAGLLPVTRLVGQQRCLVRLGEPIDVRAHRAAYQSDKRATVANLTHQFEAATQALLDQMG